MLVPLRRYFEHLELIGYRSYPVVKLGAVHLIQPDSVQV